MPETCILVDEEMTLYFSLDNKVSQHFLKEFMSQSLVSRLIPSLDKMKNDGDFVFSSLVYPKIAGEL